LKYSTRGGDIRDIWKLAVEKGKGKLLSVKGTIIKEHDISEPHGATLRRMSQN